MKNMTLEHIAQACHGTYIGDQSKIGTEMKGAVTDSRQVEEGFLFIPLKGARADGHEFIPDVIQKGAAAVLSERKLSDCAVPYIQVASSEQALKEIAEYYRSQLSIPIIGITGSVGKTSTKEMIASVLSQNYQVLKTAGNFNNEIGLPLTLLRIRREHQAAVVEMGISDFGEMHRLAKMARPDICVITNIGICHLENLKTRDGILKAKSEIFDYIKPGCHIVLNGEDDKLASIQEVKGIRPIFYGQGQEIYADQIQNCGLKGVKADIHTPKGTMKVNIPIPGEHNVYNAMAAAGVGLALDMELSDIQAGIEHAKTIGGRSNLIETGGLQVLDDCYNANPVSMRASLDVLSNGLGRTVAVLGDMGELGENEKQLHFEIGAYAAKKQITALFCAGELSEQMAQGAEETGGIEVFYFKEREKMTERLLEYLREGDTVLVKASHFMEYPEVVEAIKAKSVYLSGVI
ncbi:MAG: UDP-N-acetylmuramoyl-tripeptide--D-alanyl-D-alanine ligase [Lachnospiraceae bacterium]|nr:UDP-N-acetylmuramoyl-tripeptide--D-alanyl-D-alanine ligase [Lachnospiraceae bacterium]